MRVAVDGILSRDGKILLIKRAGRTFHNFWALPGGMVEEGELIETALAREMAEELGVQIEPIAILGAYSTKDRDPRQHTISIVFICNYTGEPKAGDDAGDCRSFELKEIEDLQLAFDHRQILSNYFAWLKNRSTYWSTKK